MVNINFTSELSNEKIDTEEVTTTSLKQSSTESDISTDESTTSSTVTDAFKKLFTESYSTIPIYPECGKILSSSSGFFSSPGFPNPYKKNINCQWIIQALPDQRIMLSFKSFVLEFEPICRYL